MGQSGELYYLDARKIAKKEYSRLRAKGLAGNLFSLDEAMRGKKILSEVDLGTVDIPLSKINGTFSKTRASSFAANYMPLLSVKSEFAQKWIGLCNAHIVEGIREPVKAFEYLNKFYIVEGNKRISVLKYFDAYSYHGNVTRLLPEKNENDKEILIYYEFLDFYKETKINTIWFSQQGSFNKLLSYLKSWQPSMPLIYENKYRYFNNSIYLAFRQIYLGLGGQNINITTGDSFLQYINLYGIPETSVYSDLRKTIENLMPELINMVSQNEIVVDDGSKTQKTYLFTEIASYISPKKKIKVAFAYPKTSMASSWTFSHEMGRKHLQKVLGDIIEVNFVENVPESNEAYAYIKKLAEDKNNIIFCTSPSFLTSSIKTALEFPDVRILNCSETGASKKVKTYFGRLYEARFLCGIVAGMLTKTNHIGYIGTYPVPEVICGINSFALGAAFVNPYVKVKVAWTYKWDSDSTNNDYEIIKNLCCDIISHHNTIISGQNINYYGLYSFDCINNSIDENCSIEPIATPVWNWGVFYEKIVKILIKELNSPLIDLFKHQDSPMNFWWGMDSGVVDFFYSRQKLPYYCQKMIEFVRQSIIERKLEIFKGPVYDNKGQIRLKKGESADRGFIVKMDWFVDVIESDVPEVESFSYS